MLGQKITLELNIDMREGGSVREASNINKRPPKLLTTPVTFPPSPSSPPWLRNIDGMMVLV